MARRRRSQASGHHRRQRGSLSVGAFAVVAVAGLLVTLAMVAFLLIISRPDGGSAGSRAIATRSPITQTATATIPRPTTARPVNRHWLDVLQALDERRQTAWRMGRPRLLGRVYLPGSAVLRADRAMLRGYVTRGLHVTGVSLHFSSVLVERHGPQSASLLVVDRLRTAIAVDTGNVRRALPRDRPSRHHIELRLLGHAWRIAAVTLG